MIERIDNAAAAVEAVAVEVAVVEAAAAAVEAAVVAETGEDRHRDRCFSRESFESESSQRRRLDSARAFRLEVNDAAHARAQLSMTYCECCGECMHMSARARHGVRRRRDHEDEYVQKPRREDLEYEASRPVERELESFIRACLDDVHHPRAKTMNRALVTVFVMSFTPNPRMDTFKLDARLEGGTVTYQNFKRRKFLRRALDWGPLAFGQTSVIVRTFYEGEGVPYKRVRGYVCWSKGRDRMETGSSRVSRDELMLAYSMSPPPPEERVEYVGGSRNSCEKIRRASVNALKIVPRHEN